MPIVVTATPIAVVVVAATVAVAFAVVVVVGLLVASDGPRRGAAVDERRVRAQVRGGHRRAVVARAVFHHRGEGVLGAARENHRGAPLVRMQQVAWGAAFVLELPWGTREGGRVEEDDTGSRTWRERTGEKLRMGREIQE